MRPFATTAAFLVVLAGCAAALWPFDGWRKGPRSPSFPRATRPMTGEGAEHRGCCAGFKDGSYYANLSLITDFGDGIVPSIGYAASDHDGNRSIMVLGCRCPEHSLMGLYVRECEEEGKLYATVWDGEEEECKTFALPPCATDRHFMCVGEGSGWETYHSTNKVDKLITLYNYHSEYKGKPLSSIAVHRATCMPVRLITVAGPKKDDDAAQRSGDSRGVRLMESLLLRRFSNSDGAADEDAELDFDPKDMNWIGMHFHNATAAAPEDEYFSVPSWCKDTYTETGVKL